MIKNLSFVVKEFIDDDFFPIILQEILPVRMCLKSTEF